MFICLFIQTLREINEVVQNRSATSGTKRTLSFPELSPAKRTPAASPIFTNSLRELSQDREDASNSSSRDSFTNWMHCWNISFILDAVTSFIDFDFLSCMWSFRPVTNWILSLGTREYKIWELRLSDLLSYNKRIQIHAKYRRLARWSRSVRALRQLQEPSGCLRCHSVGGWILQSSKQSKTCGFSWQESVKNENYVLGRLLNVQSLQQIEKWEMCKTYATITQMRFTCFPSSPPKSSQSVCLLSSPDACSLSKGKYQSLRRSRLLDLERLASNKVNPSSQWRFNTQLCPFQEQSMNTDAVCCW